MTPTFTASTLTFTSDEAKPLGQPTAEPLTGEITTRARTLSEDLDGRIKTGEWDVTQTLRKVFTIYRP